ncbi:histone-like nucleoid-structuring protein Lsr2 [Rhodococcus jostii]|uniref:Lsr2 family DNA-binding protein n=1 Tax=Rhodococcus jostii TaxID=132919 RepID=UPI00363B2BFA
MKTRGQLVVAVGAGFLLGRRTAKLASSPEVTKLIETVRGDLMSSAKAAAVTAVSSRIDSLSSRLQSSGENPVGGVGQVADTKRRSSETRDSHLAEPETSEEEPAAGDESAEGEQAWEDIELAESEGDDQADETGVTDEDGTEPPKQEERPRRPPRVRRTRDASTPKEIREWAVQEGLEISSHGRIPANIDQAFRDAH